MMNQFNLRGTKTAENLAKAFAGESQARNRYLFYSQVAKDEGFPSLAEVFLETGDDERGHAEMFYDYLTSGLDDVTLEVNVLVPVAKMQTEQNLLFAAQGEHHEWTELYPQFGKIAQQEGFEDVARSFFSIASVEKFHEARFLNLLNRFQTNTLYQLPYEVTWQCSNCGFMVKSHAAPSICPACHHKQQYFRVFGCDISRI